MTDLFRRQAVDFQRQKFHGAIVLTRSPWQATITGFFIVLVLALLAFASTHGFARKESVSGVLLPAGGVLRLTAPRAGTVAAVGEAQGHAVRGGDTVVRLTVEQSSATGSTQVAVGRSLASREDSLEDELRTQGEQARREAARFDARASSLQVAIDHQEREIALQRERVQLVRDVAARYPQLVESGAVSPVEAAEKQTELLDQQARLSELERAREGLRSELSQVRAERAGIALAADRERAQMHRDIDALVQARAENESQRELQVLAPQAGELAAVLATPGQSVAAGQTLATLLPAGSLLEAELYVPTRAAGFVRAGTPVSLRVDAFPYARYGQLPAHVREVASSTVPGSAIEGTGEADVNGGSGVYRVRVVLDAPAAGDGKLAWRAALKAGMHVQASLVAEHRTLVEWALEPLAALGTAAQ